VHEAIVEIKNSLLTRRNLHQNQERAAICLDQQDQLEVERTGKREQQAP